MSDCGLTTDIIDQAIANYCSDTTKELDNLTEELKSDSELEFTINKLNNLNTTTEITIRSHQQQNGDSLTKHLLHDAVGSYMNGGGSSSSSIDGGNAHRERDHSTSPFYTHLSENGVTNSFNNVLYDEPIKSSTTTAIESKTSFVQPTIYHHQNGNSNDCVDGHVGGSANDVCNELMLHSVNLDGEH